MLDGLVGPAHVSVVIGSEPYAQFAEKWKMPVVICGFEPLDMLMTILMLVKQVNEGRHEVENEFTRAVVTGRQPPRHRSDGPRFLAPRLVEWRGLGPVPKSALSSRLNSLNLMP